MLISPLSSDAVFQALKFNPTLFFTLLQAMIVAKVLSVMKCLSLFKKVRQINLFGMQKYFIAIHYLDNPFQR